ncbi:MAG: hypothetical protein CMP36_02390 [Rickettsiales bacterium]|nr:hypothetical protein [Rickettsiales bacterium]OUV80690.1 MAG: hypothetical protein CBC91_02920 [Rickettsiales bacterium TMED131]
MLNMYIIMLKKIVTSIKNLGTKSLIVLIALSFAVWGIGDIFNGNSNPTVASVGKSKIKLNDFNLEYQTIINSLRQNNDELVSEELIKSLGIHKSVLNNLINNEYINQLSNELGVIASEKYIKKTIFQNKNFHDRLGVFNKDYFNYFLSRNKISEKEILMISEKNLVNDVFIKTISNSINVPNVVAKNIKEKRDVVRKAEVYEINTSAMIIKKKISEKEILKHYDDIKLSLLKPEKRNINLIFVDQRHIEKSLTFSDDDILKIYNANKSAYFTPEKREIYQLIFDNTEEVKNFKIKYKNNFDIKNYINENSLIEEDISLGLISKNELDIETSKVAFSLKKQVLSDPIETSFGWKVLYVKRIVPESNINFQNAKQEIRKDLENSTLSERVYEKANLFYEKFLESNDLENSLKLSNLTNLKINALTLNDMTSLKEKKIYIEEQDLVKIIFNLEEGKLSDPIENGDASLLFIYLDKIIQSKPKTLAESKKEVTESIYNRIKRQEAMKISNDLYSKLIKNQNTDTKSFKLTKTEWVTMDQRLGEKINPKIKDVIFKTPLNKFSKIIEIDSTKFIFVRPTNQSNDFLDTTISTKLENVRISIDNSIDNDILNALLIDLKAKRKSSINESFLNSF